ncbi:hypothetical protein NE237_006308 [Protea cynaroides]|uniref:Uncharacterized protein n=1 Tax=Protea cynaroides TaxID=273540 RepID=A0A9Q0KMX4_9MAGN|nr:hypothetical protein NE237_006308 [Protea cynaroides]
MNLEWLPSYGVVDLSKESIQTYQTRFYSKIAPWELESIETYSKANSTIPHRDKVIILGDGNPKTNFSKNISTYMWKITPIQGFNFTTKMVLVCQMCGQIVSVQKFCWVSQVLIQWPRGKFSGCSRMNWYWWTDHGDTSELYLCRTLRTRFSYVGMIML